MSSRRKFIQQALVGGAGLAGIGATGNSLAQMPRELADPKYVIQNDNIRQSIMGWCFKDHFTEVELAQHCKDIGLVAMEGIPREAYPEVRKLGLEISLVGSHGFAEGPCNPEFQDQVVAKIEEAIDVAVAVKSPSATGKPIRVVTNPPFGLRVSG
ncbi:MAG: hypothetical protein AAF226_18620, partial [Verrucomicrobiota bacterium]